MGRVLFCRRAGKLRYYYLTLGVINILSSGILLSQGNPFSVVTVALAVVMLTIGVTYDDD